MQRIDVITLMPQMFAAMDFGVVGKAINEGLVKLHVWHLRDFATDKHRTVDDKPYGGGPGMLLKAEPLSKAIQAAKQENPDAKVIYLSPRGEPLNQGMLKTLQTQSGLILIAGRYEGIDERIIELYVDQCVSIGDYVLSGGDIPCMALIDGLVRLLPGCVGHEMATDNDSFSHDLLEHPQYTRPEVFEGKNVPEVLLSGNHQAIAHWQHTQSLVQTWQHRPDMLAKKTLTAVEKQLLNEFIEQKH